MHMPRPGCTCDHGRKNHALSNEARHLGVGWFSKKQRRCCDLQELAFVHHRNAISQRHGFRLVVGDVKHCRARAFVEA